MHRIFGAYSNYDPRFIEAHSDSSDFDIEVYQKTTEEERRKKQSKNVLDHMERRVKRKKKHQPVNHVNLKMRQGDYNEPISLVLNSARNNNILHHCEMEELQQTHKQNKKEKNKQENIEYKIKDSPSKWYQLKQKLIPRISTIFCRNNTSSGKQTTSNEENQFHNTYSYTNLNQRQFVKTPVQPIYFAVKNNPQTPAHLGASKYVQVPPQPNQSNSSIYSNTESGLILQENEKVRRKFREEVKKQIRNEYMKYIADKKGAKNQEQQFPSSPEVYNVLSCCRNRNQEKNAESYDSEAVPSSSSEFWDILFDNITQKYQGEYNIDNCLMGNCVQKEVKPEPAFGCCRQCSKDPKNQPQPVSHNKTEQGDVECHCYPDKKQVKPQIKLYQPPRVIPGPIDDVNRPCQQPHDLIKRKIQDKFNAEVLCIHNPPCVLINGCLNIPTSSQEPTPLNVFSAAEEGSFGNRLRIPGCKKKTNEQGCQYHSSSADIRHCETQVSEYRTDKIIQSLCYHKPPCEIIRCCQKIKYDPIMEDSCIHIPMCSKAPEYKRNQNMCYQHSDIEEQVNTCSNLPSINRNQCNFSHKRCDCQCAGSPLRERKLIELTRRENFCGQVKPDDDPTFENYCVHVPMCQKLPECYVDKKEYHELKREPSNHQLGQKYFSHNYSEVPICSMGYLECPTRDTTSTQVKSQSDQKTENLREPVPTYEKLPKYSKASKNRTDDLMQYYENSNSSKSKIYSQELPCNTHSVQAEYSTAENCCSPVSRIMHAFFDERQRTKRQKTRSKYCEHNPKCPEIPICKKNYLPLTARDNVSTQIKPKPKMICRHEPPCIRIPKCIENTITSNFMPYESIPECVHRPTCETIPACCRKPKGMTSVSSQYPGSCRIV